MTRFALLMAGASVVLLGLVPDHCHAAFVTGVNLIVNGNAEAGTGSATGNNDVAVPGFTTAGNFTVVKYDIGGGFPASTDAGPTSRGANFFAGGQSNASSSATQVIDISGGAVTIDGGGVTFALSGFLGGFSTQGDNAVLTATFLGGSALGTAGIGPVTAANRGNNTGLLFRDTTGRVPVGTRSISLTLQMTRTDGSYNDGYADDLSLVLTAADVPPVTAVPAPASAALLGLSSAAFGAWRRSGRRRAA